jgi:hypothetical protein
MHDIKEIKHGHKRSKKKKKEDKWWTAVIINIIVSKVCDWVKGNTKLLTQ